MDIREANNLCCAIDKLYFKALQDKAFRFRLPKPMPVESTRMLTLEDAAVHMRMRKNQIEDARKFFPKPEDDATIIKTIAHEFDLL